jgi:hypothetical protein
MKSTEPTRTISVTAGVTKQESTEIREYCSQFEVRMRDVLRELILWAMKNAPTRSQKVLMLGNKAIDQPCNDRTLRGVKPGSKNGSK